MVVLFYNDAAKKNASLQRQRSVYTFIRLLWLYQAPNLLPYGE